MLAELAVPGRPTKWDNSRARAYCACNKCGLSSLSLSGERPDID